MRELELGEISPVRSRNIPIVHEDDVSGIRREPKEKRSLYFYKFRYEVQISTGGSNFTTKTGEKDIHVKCNNGLSKEEIDTLAHDKLESSFMSNDRLIDTTIIFKKKIF